MTLLSIGEIAGCESFGRSMFGVYCKPAGYVEGMLHADVCVLSTLCEVRDNIMHTEKSSLSFLE